MSSSARIHEPPPLILAVDFLDRSGVDLSLNKRREIGDEAFLGRLADYIEERWSHPNSTRVVNVFRGMNPKLWEHLVERWLGQKLRDMIDGVSRSWAPTISPGDRIEVEVLRGPLPSVTATGFVRGVSIGEVDGSMMPTLYVQVETPRRSPTFRDYPFVSYDPMSLLDSTEVR